MGASTGEGYGEPARGRTGAPRHDVRALLRAHLAAASGYRHLTRHCAVCARLLRLAMEPVTASRGAGTADEPPGAPEASTGDRRAPARASRAEDVSPPTT
ncbi:hypothetical protein EAO73_32665 [Streptomyces sp. col6]|uniref:DUF6274 family protein n=1 Tax=Streptomyces sp. col6 TaxID=2478958 RepID=UPI0011CDBEC7|nr:DUF6274 family protein [Streptomyces sp. col6]TXR96284.1 hypothetical protein EAO73_32665 [Streptomyces sp. col6]